jgi:hypothetical protein
MAGSNRLAGGDKWDRAPPIGCVAPLLALHRTLKKTPIDPIINSVLALDTSYRLEVLLIRTSMDPFVAFWAASSVCLPATM